MKIDSDKLFEWREQIEGAIGEIHGRMSFDELESVRGEFSAVADAIFECYLDALLEERKELGAKSERSDSSFPTLDETAEHGLQGAIQRRRKA